MKKTVTVIIVLLICFLVGFSIPYIYQNYGPVLEKYVSGNGRKDVDPLIEPDQPEKEKPQKEPKEEKPREEKIDYNQYLKTANDSFYNGNYDKTIDTYLTLYNNGYDKLEIAKNIIAVSDYSNSSRQKVETLLDKTYGEYKDSLEYNYYFGKYLYEHGQRQKAKDIFNHLVVLLDEKQGISKRKVALMYYYLGNIYNEQNDIEAALDFYKAGIENNREIVLNYLKAAEIYDLQDNYDQAIEMYQSALNVDHSLSSIYYELALLYEKKGELLKAYHYWDRCVNSGIETAEARERIKDIRQKYPEYFKQPEPEERPKQEIDWFAIEEIEPNETYKEIKIGIQENIDRISFQSQYDFMISQGNDVVFKGEKNTRYQVNYRNHTFYILKKGDILQRVSTNQDLKIYSENTNNLFAIYNIKYAQNYFWGGTENRQYRGDIYLNTVSAQNIDLINAVDLTSYMLSVVPSEMPASWPEEALKAQSVVARSYILKNINRHQNEEYDLCASVHCIVYAGAQNENTNTTEAILATRNEIITHNGNVIDAVFSSNSGGYTEASENVWGNSFDYLKAVNTSTNDEFQFPLRPYEIENWFIEKPNSYSNNKYTTQSSYRWVKNIDLDNLKERHELDEVKRVYISDRTTTGTVKEVKIEGLNRTVTVSNSSIRRALTGLKSNKFIIKNIYVDNKLENVIIFGAGWGHSVGMDQSAAAGMAVQGKGYKDIIRYFYPDTEITKLQ